MGTETNCFPHTAVECTKAHESAEKLVGVCDDLIINAPGGDLSAGDPGDMMRKSYSPGNLLSGQLTAQTQFFRNLSDRHPLGPEGCRNGSPLSGSKRTFCGIMSAFPPKADIDDTAKLRTQKADIRCRLYPRKRTLRRVALDVR